MIACAQFPTKRRYRTKAEAKLGMRRARHMARRRDVHAYLCAACGEWHLGHKR